MYVNFIIITASAQTLSRSQLFGDNLAGSLNKIKQPARLRHSSGPSGGGKMRVGGARTGKLMGRLFRPQELAVSVLAHRRGNNGEKLAVSVLAHRRGNNGEKLAVSVLAHRRGNNGEKRSKTPLQQKGLDQEWTGEFAEARNVSQMIPSLWAELKEDISLFRGGRLQQSVENWKLITSDSEILQTVTGLGLEFDRRESPWPRPPIPSVSGKLYRVTVCQRHQL